MDGDPSNNSHENLRVLCVDCHSKQPYHTHLLRGPEKQVQIAKIKVLREKQRISDLGLDL